MSFSTEDEHVKTVYAHFGLAMYLAQCLEHGLANALIYLDLIPRKAKSVRTKQEWIEAFDSFMGRNFEKTLGALIRSLRDLTVIPPELGDKLTQSLKLRNWLAHHFFRERAAEFASFSGRDSMIRELKAAQELFETTDDLLDSTIELVRTKYGFTDEKVAQIYTEFVSQINHNSDNEC